MIVFKNLDVIIKNVIIYLIFSNIIFNEHIYIKIDSTKKNVIEIDNRFKINLFEDDASFNEYQTYLKPIAFYYPDYNNISYFKLFKKNKNINKFNNNDIEQLIEAQIKLAKNHGIYGFAIYYDLFNTFNQINDKLIGYITMSSFRLNKQFYFPNIIF